MIGIGEGASAIGDETVVGAVGALIVPTDGDAKVGTEGAPGESTPVDAHLMSRVNVMGEGLVARVRFSGATGAGEGDALFVDAVFGL